MIDGAHSKTDAINLANYLRTINLPKYGIWAMTKNKEPDLFIKQFKGLFKKIVTMRIENEKNSLSANELQKISSINKINTITGKSFYDSLKKISSNEKKLIDLLSQKLADEILDEIVKRQSDS